MSGERDRHRRLYRAIPSMTCERGCSECCGPAPLSPWEAERLGIAGAVATPVHPGTTRCAFLIDGRCSVYARRPFICRVFGTAEVLPCPRGRAPRGDRVIPLVEMIALVKSFEDGCPPGWQEARRRAVRDVVARDGTADELGALDACQRLARGVGSGAR